MGDARVLNDATETARDEGGGERREKNGRDGLK